MIIINVLRTDVFDKKQKNLEYNTDMLLIVISWEILENQLMPLWHR